MPRRPVLSPALVAVQFAKPLRNITALHDAGIRAADTPETEHQTRLRRAAATTMRHAVQMDKLTRTGFWRQDNAAKAGGCVVSNAKTGEILRRL